jgi:hypothetical protein
VLLDRPDVPLIEGANRLLDSHATPNGLRQATFTTDIQDILYLICASRFSGTESALALLKIEHEGSTSQMERQQVLQRLEKAWREFQQSYAGLTNSELLEPGVIKAWSVRDILAHVTTWEEEALKAFPVLLEGKRTPSYRALYGGIDSFNAKTTEQKRAMSLSQVREELERTHRRVIEYVQSVPEEQFTRETRFRRRLRLDTYSHYPIHAKAIRKWREQRFPS